MDLFCYIWRPQMAKMGAKGSKKTAPKRTSEREPKTNSFWTFLKGSVELPPKTRAMFLRFLPTNYFERREFHHVSFCKLH